MNLLRNIPTFLAMCFMLTLSIQQNASATPEISVNPPIPNAVILGELTRFSVTITDEDRLMPSLDITFFPEVVLHGNSPDECNTPSRTSDDRTTMACRLLGKAETLLNLDFTAQACNADEEDIKVTFSLTGSGFLPVDLTVPFTCLAKVTLKSDENVSVSGIESATGNKILDNCPLSGETCEVRSEVNQPITLKLEPTESLFWEGVAECVAGVDCTFTPTENTNIRLTSTSEQGYAILIQGSIKNDRLREAYAKTLDRVYQRLEPAFSKDNIFYISQKDISRRIIDSDLIDAVPTIANVNNAFQSVKNAIAGENKPLYIVMVNHGEIHEGKIRFYLMENNGTEQAAYIDAEQLSKWLSDLTVNTTNRQIYLVIGTCYAEAFIQELAEINPNHDWVIITSSATEERSYAGAQELDGIRTGEYFVELLFKYIVDEQSTIRQAFDFASEEVKSYVRKFSDLRQTPHLETNGDGEGRTNAELDSLDFASRLLDAKIVVTNPPEPPPEVEILTKNIVESGSSFLISLKVNQAMPAERRFYAQIVSPNDPLSNSVDEGQDSGEQIMPKTDAVELVAGTDDIFTYKVEYDCFDIRDKYNILYYTELDSRLYLFDEESTIEQTKGDNTPCFYLQHVQPTNGSTVTDNNGITVDWKSEPDASKYAFAYTTQYSDLALAGDDYQQVTNQTLLTQSQITIFFPIDSNNENYYWRVYVLNEADEVIKKSHIYQFKHIPSGGSFQCRFSRSDDIELRSVRNDDDRCPCKKEPNDYILNFNGVEHHDDDSKEISAAIFYGKIETYGQIGTRVTVSISQNPDIKVNSCIDSDPSHIALPGNILAVVASFADQYAVINAKGKLVSIDLSKGPDVWMPVLKENPLVEFKEPSAIKDQYEITLWRGKIEELKEWSDSEGYYFFPVYHLGADTLDDDNPYSRVFYPPPPGPDKDKIERIITLIVTD